MEIWLDVGNVKNRLRQSPIIQRLRLRTSFYIFYCHVANPGDPHKAWKKHVKNAGKTQRPWPRNRKRRKFNRCWIQNQPRSPTLTQKMQKKNRGLIREKIRVSTVSFVLFFFAFSYCGFRIVAGRSVGEIKPLASFENVGGPKCSLWPRKWQEVV